MNPRVRIAPSPTGYFHVGTARTALFNWLFAKQQGGEFLLRIEDTDAARNRSEHTEGILRALEWLDLMWDEDPVFQSQRGELYDAAVEKLVADGNAYACECAGSCDGHCRDAGLEAIPGRMVRFRTPDSGQTSFDDLIRGNPVVENTTIEDFGIRKSNGGATFYLANVVDDADMKISHVVRGADHISNTHKYVLLWDSLGCGTPPVFAHLPLINNAQGKKLSKRRDKVAVEDYRDEGYLPEAMVNYLALLGWAPGDDREVLTREEMIAEFRLEDVRSSPAIFDEVKMQSVNSEYLRAMPVSELVERSQGWLRDRWVGLAPLVQERARTFGQVYSLTDFLFRAEPDIDGASWAKAARKDGFLETLKGAHTRLEALEDWSEAAITAVIAGDETVPKLNQAPIRLAVLGRPVGLPIYESLAALGKDRTIARLASAIQRAEASG